MRYLYEVLNCRSVQVQVDARNAWLGSADRLKEDHP